MMSVSDLRPAESPAANLPRILEWALPEPVMPSGVRVCHTSRSDVPEADAIILASRHWYQRARFAPDLAGYGWQRSFQAFPDSDAPRFLYPGSGHFRSFPQLVRPRSSATGKMLLSRILTAMPAVVHVRAQEIIIATRRESDLVRQLHHHFDESRTAVFVGNRKGPPRPAIWGQDEDGVISVVARYRSGPDEAARLAREHNILRRLQHFPSVSTQVPESYGLISGHLGSMLVTEGFDGDPGSLKLGPREDAWLASCTTGPPLPAGHSPLVQGVVAAAEPHPLLREVAVHASSTLGPVMVPATIVHGDFVPWNILSVGESLKVFDWEAGVIDGIPGWDGLFFRLRVGILLSKWDRSELVEQIAAAASEGHPCYDPASWRAVLLLLLVHLCLIDDIPERQHILETILANDLAMWWKGTT